VHQPPTIHPQPDRLPATLLFPCSYACFYVTRTCFNYVNPIMLKDESINLTLTAVGTISSLLPIAYAFSKGLSGFLGSALSPRLLLATGLSATGLCCLAFGFGSSALWFMAFWTLNGLLQVRAAAARCTSARIRAWRTRCHAAESTRAMRSAEP
jgi:sugar phosphate permease